MDIVDKNKDHILQVIKQRNELTLEEAVIFDTTNDDAWGVYMYNDFHVFYNMDGKITYVSGREYNLHAYRLMEAERIFKKIRYQLFKGVVWYD